MNNAPFSDPVLARKLIDDLRTKASRMGHVKIMEVCGTHTMEIARLGLRSLLPENMELVSGPGCPVCVTPGSVIDAAAMLALEKSTHVLTFGDMIRVPGNTVSLAEARARGAKVSVLTSPLQSVALATENPGQQFVFVAVGFETTIPVVARAITLAREAKLGNLSFLVCHRIVPPALDALVADKELGISGFLLPGHVSAIIGEAAYGSLVQRGIPSAITGFEALDILAGLTAVVDMVHDGTPKIVNAYTRVVRPEGNPPAQALIKKVFQVVDAAWRGIGTIPASGLRLREEYGDLDAEKLFSLSLDSQDEQPAGCLCGPVLKGLIRPDQCPAFGRACTPETPKGPCMVSTEGSCAAYFRYR